MRFTPEELERALVEGVVDKRTYDELKASAADGAPQAKPKAKKLPPDSA
jgi:hypothetical protein